MRPILLYIILILGIDNNTAAQLNNTPQYNFIGLQALSSKQLNALGLFVNSANVAYTQKKCIGLNYQNRFFIKEAASNYNIAANVGFDKQFAGLAVSSIVGSVLNQHQVTLNYGRLLAKNIGLSLLTNFYAYAASGIGSDKAYSMGLAAYYMPIQNFSMGIQVNNILGNYFTKLSIEKPALHTNFSLGYDFSPNFYVGANFEKKSGLAADFAVLAVYNYSQKIQSSIGFQANSSLVFFGVGYTYKNVQLIVSNNYSFTLGLSSGLSVNYAFHNSKNE